MHPLLSSHLHRFLRGEQKSMALFSEVTKDMTVFVKDIVKVVYVFGPDKFYSSCPNSEF